MIDISRGKITFKRKIEFDEAASAIIVFHIILMMCKNMLVVSNEFFYQNNNAFNNIILVLVLAMYLVLTFRYNLLNRINTRTWIAVVLLASFFIVSFLFDPNLFVSNSGNYFFVNYQLRLFIAYCLPLFIVVSSLTTMKYFKEMYFRFAIIPFFVAIVCFFLKSSSLSNISDYSMSFGYSVMPICMVYLIRYSNNRKWRYLLFAAITFTIILLDGSRGPLVSIFVLIAYLVISTRTTTYSLVLKVIFILLAAVAFLNFDKILAFVNQLLSNFNISSRTLDLLLRDFFHDSGRAALHEKIIFGLRTSPIIGYGAFGGEKLASLAHNLYLDIFANVGYPFGVGFLFVLFFATIKKLRHYTLKSDYSELLILFIIMVFPRGFFSCGLWSEKELWIFFGMLLQKTNNCSIGGYENEFAVKHKKIA